MQSAITISLVPEAKGGPFVFWDDLTDGCKTASQLGFDAIEIFPATASSISRPYLKALLARYSLKVAAIGTGAGWVVNKWHLIHADSSIRELAVNFIREMIDLAGEFNAPAIIGSMQGRVEGEVTREQALHWMRAALEELGHYAERHNVPLLFEPLNRYETNLFNRIGSVAEFIDSLKTQNVRILADLFHMNIEEASIASALRDAARHLGHIHFADSNRLAIGMGHTAMVPIINALKEIGYSGYLSGEVLPLPDSHAAAAQTAQAFRHLLAGY